MPSVGPILVRAAVAVVASLAAGACGGGDPAAPEPAPAGAVLVAVRTDAAVAEVSPRFLSFAIDTSQVAGGHWWSAGEEPAAGGVGAARVPPFDFARPRLRRLAAPLAPAWLRIGGSEADVVYYDLGDVPVAQPPAPYELVFTRAMWDAMASFARDSGFDVAFTLNAGPGPRDAARAWVPDQSEALIRHARGRGDPVGAWELGNEINGFPVVHGLDFRIDGSAYAADMAVARALVDREHPGALLMGPSSAYWPVAGEMNAVLPDFLAAGGGLVDVVTWHYYPQQSRRCPIHSRPAGAEVMLDPAALDEVAIWAAAVEAERDAHAPGTPVWLGESGNAQCGGEPGVSDTFAGGFWWLDQLGLLARRGVPVVVRQTLSGADYGLIRDEDLSPNPDYFASVVWKRVMGTRVLDVPRGAGVPATLRTYAHCAAGAPGDVAFVLIHLGAEAPLDVALDLPGATSIDAWVMTAGALTGRDLRLNGTPVAVADDGTLPPLAPDRLDRTWLTLPPRSQTFAVAVGADAAACR